MTIHKRAEDLIRAEITGSRLGFFGFMMALKKTTVDCFDSYFDMQLLNPFSREDIMFEFERVYNFYQLKNGINHEGEYTEKEILDFIDSHYVGASMWKVSGRIGKMLREKGEFVVGATLSGYFWLKKTEQDVYMNKVVLEIASELIS